MSNYKHPNLWRGCVGAWCPSQQSPGGLTLFDQTTNKHHGTLTGMDPATDWVMDDGYALDFDGANDKVEIANVSNLPTGTASRTLAAWVNVSGNGGVILSFNVSSGQRYILEMVDYYGTWYIFTDGVNASNNVTITGTQIPAANEWHHIAFIKDGSDNWEYYLDGVLKKSGTFIVSINTSALTSAWIGGRSDLPSSYLMLGMIDDSRTYDRALFADEVSQLYNGGQRGVAYEKKRRVISSIPSEVRAPPAVRRGGQWRHPNLWDGCVGAWAPSQQSPGGLTLFDQTTNKHHGTLTGMDPATDWVMDEGGALDFDGSNDSVTVADSPKLNFGSGGFSISLWAFLKNAGSNEEVFEKQGTSRFYQAFLSHGSIGLSFMGGETGAGSQFQCETTSLGLNAWHHLTFVRDAVNGPLIYLDGDDTGATVTKTSFSESVSNDSDLSLGAGTGGSANGMFDDIRIYDRALDANEIRQLYNGGQRGAAYQRGSKLLSAPTAVATASTVPYYYNTLLTGSGV